LIEAATAPTATMTDAMVEINTTVVEAEVDGGSTDTAKAAKAKEKRAAKAKEARAKKKANAEAKKKKVTKATKPALKTAEKRGQATETAVLTTAPVVESVQTKEKHVCCASITNHQAFNLKSEFIAGYAATILRGVGCSGPCALHQVVPATNKPVWLCPILNSSGQAQCRFALCNDCFGIANMSSGSLSRKRKKKNLD
jgi:hypothetical protein